MNSITRNLNIAAILTKNKNQKQIFCQYNYIFGLHMQEAIFKVNTLKEIAKIYIKMMFKIL